MVITEGERAVVMNYTPLGERQKQAIHAIKSAVAMAIDQVIDLEAEFGRQRDYSLAKTHLQEACMWAVRGIANPEAPSRDGPK